MLENYRLSEPLVLILDTNTNNTNTLKQISLTIHQSTSLPVHVPLMWELHQSYRKFQLYYSYSNRQSHYFVSTPAMWSAWTMNSWRLSFYPPAQSVDTPSGKAVLVHLLDTGICLGKKGNKKYIFRLCIIHDFSFIIHNVEFSDTEFNNNLVNKSFLLE